MKKWLLRLSLFLFALVIVAYSTLTLRNNQSVTMPEQARIETAYAAAVSWATEHQDQLLNESNVALWWMLQQSARLTHDPALTTLFERYRQKYLQSGKNIWAPLFFPGRWIPFNLKTVANYDDYQLHFLYAISCDEELARLPVIQAQLTADYCAAQPWRPACATHQLMGLRFMQLSECGNATATLATIAAVQQRVIRQLTWDPRVVDVTMQRVLMLAETGKPEAIKPIWLERLMDAQNPEGGWSSFDPLVTLPLGAKLGFSNRGLSLREPVSSFHMTAQGILLMALLLHPAAADQ